MNLIEIKRKGSLCSFFSPKRKVREIENEQLSKVDGEGELEGERKDVEENVTEIDYNAKLTRDRRRWENATGVKIWRESITKMRMEKARDNITCRAQPVKGKGECLVHMVWKLLLHSILSYI